MPGWSDASSPLYDGIPLGKPALRIWELNETSTSYDKQRAAPSDATMRRVWTAWSTFFFAFAAFNIIVFLGIVTARKVRRRPFNVYVIFLMIPDIIYTLSCAIQCALLAARNGFQTPLACQIQSFYLMFGLTANSWMNALVARELRRLLTWSGRRGRYKPPPYKTIVRDSLVVYFASACISFISWVVNVPWWPHRTDLQNGLVCLPMAYDMASTLVFWLLFFPVMSAIPLMYCAWVAFDVWRRNLLPPPGKRRELMIYFYRITGVFAVMWVPGVFFFYVSAAFPKEHVWAIYIASVWSHSQGAVAAAVSMLKEDVYRAVMNLIWCRGQWDEAFLTQKKASSRVTNFGNDSGNMITGPSRMMASSGNQPTSHTEHDEERTNDEESDLYGDDDVAQNRLDAPQEQREEGDVEMLSRINRRLAP